jgi:hypothetical protein
MIQKPHNKDLNKRIKRKRQEMVINVKGINFQFSVLLLFLLNGYKKKTENEEEEEKERKFMLSES